MGKARVSKKHTTLLIHSEALALPIPLGELDSFTKTSRTTNIVTRPVGFINEGSTIQYGGWDLSFDGGKVDWALAHFHFLQDQALTANKQPPKFFITETIHHFNGTLEQWTYRDVTLFGFEGETGDGEQKESMKGFSPRRTMGPVDTTVFDIKGGNLVRELIFRTLGDTNASLLGSSLERTL